AVILGEGLGTGHHDAVADAVSAALLVVGTVIIGDALRGGPWYAEAGVVTDLVVSAGGAVDAAAGRVVDAGAGVITDLAGPTVGGVGAGGVVHHAGAELVTDLVCRTIG